MCPLRLILIFLSATLAGFFVLRNLKSDGPKLEMLQDEQETYQLENPNKSPHQFSKVRSAVESGFWTVVDMASGRYLWRHLASSTASKQSD
ncbi:hypothetical protein TB2_005759 [Malus domestica]|uniref:uncharacterized protein LOC126591526 n=1 Tax=Malus sylvestris TaxID=3752 RepID=UPI0021AC5683|nr:uncharacterized protein LOC126591526 [Malus sylvestris]XP_050113188.1 uncharacterized protein LOC126591526 [Malus sylvestris]